VCALTALGPLHPHAQGCGIQTGGRHTQHPPRRTVTLHYAIVLLVIALIATVLCFSGVAAGAAGIAKILFVVFLILAIAGFVSGRSRGS
jgi:uncharacterized membrane protein YtjA (UPF0391 family)